MTADGDNIVGTGAVVDVAVHPENPFVVYAATAGGGVWCTRDAADDITPTWAPLTDQYPSMATSAVAFAPADPQRQTLYAGTGSFSSFGPTGPAVGIYRTQDGGYTWRIVGGTELTGCLVRHILPLRPPNGDVVLVSGISNASPGGLFRSPDGGETFPLLSGNGTSGLLAGDAYELVEDPLNPGRVYAGIGGSSAGLYVSTDAGQTWSPINGGLAQSDLQSIAWIRLALRPGLHGAASELYAAIITSTWTLANIYRAGAIGGRESWTRVPPPTGGTAKIYTDGQSWKFALAADPQHPMLFVAADEGGVWRADLSDPSRPKWTQISPQGVPHADAQGFVFDHNADLVACNDGGVFRLQHPSTGPRWRPIGSTIRNDEPLSVAYDTLSDIVTVGAADNGVAYQQNTGLPTFVSLGTGDGGGQGVDNAANSTSERYAVWVETAGLQSFTRYTFDAQNIEGDSHHVDLTNMPDADHKESAGFAVNNLPEYGKRLLVGGTRLFESIDSGSSVQLVLDLQSNRPQGPLRMCYGARETNGAPHPEVAYVGIGNQVWIRGAGAAQFSQSTTYPGTGTIAHLGVDVQNWRRAYVLENTHVWFTPDAGATWTECTGNLIQIATDAQGGSQLGQVLTYRPSPSSAQEAVVVGGMGGIFRTLNPGAASNAVWKKFGANLPGCFGQELKYYPRQRRGGAERGDVLVASLQGRGAWTLANASQHLLQPPVLEVTASAPHQVVRLSLSATVPGLLEVYNTLPGPGSPVFTVPISALERILVRCQGDDNTLIVDNSRGHIALPIDFENSGNNRNMLRLLGGVTPNCQLTLRGSNGEVTLGGAARINFSRVQQFDNTSRGGVFGVTVARPIEQLEILDGPALGGVPSLTVLTRQGTQEFRIQTTNQTLLELTTAAAVGQVQLTDFLQRPPMLQRLIVRGRSQPNDVRITSTPTGLVTQVEGGGAADRVSIGSLTGSGGSLDDIKGPIHISNTASKTTLVVDGSRSAQPVAVGVLDATTLTGLAPAVIEFDAASIASLDLAIAGGSLTVQACTVPTAVIGGPAITALEIVETSASFDFTSGSFIDRVTLGNGTLARLRAAVGIHGTSTGNVNVTLDNSADAQPRDVVLNAQSVIGFGPAPVTLTAGAGNPALNGLSIRSGMARTAYSVVDTPDLFTVALAGQGQDVVQAAGARQRLDIGGASAVTLGSPTSSLARFGGEVHIGPGAPTSLTIDDRASTGTRQGGLDAAQLGGLARFPIVYSSATLHALRVLFGAGQTSFTVGATPAGASTALALGSGAVRLYLQACGGPVEVTAAGGGHQVVVSSTAPDVDKAVLTTFGGPIHFGTGSQFVDLVLGEGGDQTPRTGELSSTALVGLGLGFPVTFGPLHSLALRLSRFGNRVACTGTPPGGVCVLRTGGEDVVEVTLRPGVPCQLSVDASRGSQDRLHVVVENAAAGQVSRTPPAGPTPGSIRVTRPGGAVQVVSYTNVTVS